MKKRNASSEKEKEVVLETEAKRSNRREIQRKERKKNVRFQGEYFDELVFAIDMDLRPQMNWHMIFGMTKQTNQRNATYEMQVNLSMCKQARDSINNYVVHSL